MRSNAKTCARGVRWRHVQTEAQTPPAVNTVTPNKYSPSHGPQRAGYGQNSMPTPSARPSTNRAHAAIGLCLWTAPPADLAAGSAFRSIGASFSGDVEAI